MMSLETALILSIGNKAKTQKSMDGVRCVVEKKDGNYHIYWLEHDRKFIGGQDGLSLNDLMRELDSPDLIYEQVWLPVEYPDE